MPLLAPTPTRFAVFHYTRTNDRFGEDDREPTEWVFDTFDEAADKAEDLDAADTRSGHWYGVDDEEPPA
jgi:hypothetical protein